MRDKDAKFILFLVLVVCGLYLLRAEKQAAEKRQTDMSSTSGAVGKNPGWDKIEKSIDYHMKTGRGLEEMRRDLTAIENELRAPPINEVDPTAFDPEGPIPLKLKGQGDAARIYKELQKERARRPSLTPEQQITSKINRDLWEREYQQAYEQEYLKAYIENARKAGYRVKLNEKGEIVNVVEIDTEEPLRFPQSVDESGEKATPGGSQ